MKRFTYILFTLLFSFLVLFNVACTDSEQANDAMAEESGDSSKGTISLDQLITSAEQARQKASESDFEWNTIQPLLDRGHEAMEKGDEAQAYHYFSEAKAHADLAIAQAEYADENWQLLVPVIEQ